MLKKSCSRKLRGARNCLHISEKLMEVDSKVVLIMSNGLFFN